MLVIQGLVQQALPFSEVLFCVWFHAKPQSCRKVAKTALRSLQIVAPLHEVTKMPCRQPKQQGR